jgi:hypothetical protein
LNKDKREITRIAEAIERYLSDHGAAADSTENITKWWLGHPRYYDSIGDVQKALDSLVAKGRIARTKNADGTYIYQKQK